MSAVLFSLGSNHSKTKQAGKQANRDELVIIQIVCLCVSELLTHRSGALRRLPRLKAAWSLLMANVFGVVCFALQAHTHSL